MERKKYKTHTLKRTVLKIAVKTDCILQKIEVMRKNGEKKKMCDRLGAWFNRFGK